MNSLFSPVLQAIQRDPATALAVAGGAYLVLLLLLIWNLVQSAGIVKRQARLLRGADGASLERMLREQIDAAADVRDQISEAANRGAANTSQLRLCLQKTGMIRYDAFADVGGQQSFSLALLDADDNGVVMSGLFSRHDMRVYAKPIVAGASAQLLTNEEKQAIVASATASGAAPTGRRR